MYSASGGSRTKILWWGAGSIVSSAPVISSRSMAAVRGTSRPRIAAHRMSWAISCRRVQATMRASSPTPATISSRLSSAKGSWPVSEVILDCMMSPSSSSALQRAQQIGTARGTAGPLHQVLWLPRIPVSAATAAGGCGGGSNVTSTKRPEPLDHFRNSYGFVPASRTPGFPLLRMRIRLCAKNGSRAPDRTASSMIIRNLRRYIACSILTTIYGRGTSNLPSNENAQSGRSLRGAKTACSNQKASPADILRRETREKEWASCS